MEGRDREVLGGRAEDAREPLAQRGRRGRGERDGHDGGRRNAALLDEVGDAAGEHRGFAAARAGQHAERAFAGGDDLALARGKVAEVHSGVSEVATPRVRLHRLSAPASASGTRCRSGSTVHHTSAVQQCW